MNHLVAFLLLLAPLAAFAAMRRQPVEEIAGEFAADPELPAALDAPSFLESIGLSAMSMTRGERNNNPGNIRRTPVDWKGEISGTDKAFETFATPAEGIRALAKLLKNYQRVYGLNTVREIITRYAPASENNTAAYIRAVAARIGVGPDDRIDTTNPDQLAALVAAIVTHENGRNIYSAADIYEGVHAA